MANLTRLLSRRPRIDEAEVEDVRERTMARLAGLGGETPPTNEAATTDAVAAEGVAPEAPTAEVVAPAIDASAPPVEAPKPTGPKVIVPRTIALGPPPATPVEAPVHRTPPIIVAGEPETTDATVEPVVAVVEETDSAAPDAVADIVAETVVEPAAGIVDEPASVIALPAPVTQDGGVTEVVAAADIANAEVGAETPEAASVAEPEPDPTVEATVVEATVVEAEAAPIAADGIAEPAVAVDVAVAAVVAPRTVKARKVAPKTKATPASRAAPAKAKASTPRTKAAAPTAPKPQAKTDAAPKPAKRPAEAVPVKAQPTPVIDPGAVWPGKWLRDVSPDAPVADAPDQASSPAPKPAVVRRDPSLPVPRVAVIADDWDGGAAEVATIAETAATAVAVAEPEVAVEAAAVAEPVPAEIVAAEPATAVAEPVAAVAEPVAEAIAEPAVATVAEPAVATVAVTRLPKPAAPARKAQVGTPRKPGPRPAPPARAKTPPTPPVSPGVTVVAAFCPYCALALEPPPTASRRCTRCRQRIVVKRVQGRVVYLTEAAVEVFDSERIRSANFGRWSKERAQWLKLATSVGADAGRIGRLGAAPLSEKVVESSRTLYLSTTERSYREAKRDDRWEDASRMKRDQAAALYRLAGSPVPPPADVLAMHREAAAAELRGIGKMARDAELVGSSCCSICTADDGRTYRIVTELKTPRLPHDGCPKGLCHCRWEFALRDAAMVRRYLKRTRGKPKSPSA